MHLRAICLTLVVLIGSHNYLRAQDAEAPGVDGAKAELAQTWLKFLAGNWKGVDKSWTADDDWQEATFTETAESVAGGMAVLGKSKNSQGDESVVLTLWDPSSNAMVRRGVASIGITWTETTSKMTEDSLEFEIKGSMPTGATVVGSSTMQKTGPSSYKHKWSVSLDGTEVAKGSGEAQKKSSTKPGPGALETIE